MSTRRNAAIAGALVCGAVGLTTGLAAAARPAPASIFGGGFVGPVYEPITHYDVQFISIRVARGGKTFDFGGYWTGRCTGVSSPVTIEIRRNAVRISPDGSFAVTGDLKQHSKAVQGPWGLSGKFTRPTAASGMARVTFSFSENGQARHCTASFSWEARAEHGGTPPPGSPQPRGGAAYYGETSAGLPVVVRVRSDGQGLAQAAVLWNAKCQKHGGYLSDFTVVAPTAVERDGSFFGNEHYQEHGGLGPGLVGNATAIYTGRFRGSSATGTWQIGIEVKNESGKVLDHCLTGRLQFRVDL